MLDGISCVVVWTAEGVVVMVMVMIMMMVMMMMMTPLKATK